jgi:hypothetical protein
MSGDRAGRPRGIEPDAGPSHAWREDEPQFPPRLAAGCDCPCHTGGDVFHIVSCCGSLLGTLSRPRQGYERRPA